MDIFILYVPDIVNISVEINILFLSCILIFDGYTTNPVDSSNT